MPQYTGFPIKDARFLKLKNIPDLHSDEKKGKMLENFDFSYLMSRLASPLSMNHIAFLSQGGGRSEYALAW